MKTKEIAQIYGIDQREFENFLQARQLTYKKSMFSSLTVNDSDVGSYARSFIEYQEEMEIRRKAEEEAKRKAEEEARRKAEEEARRKAEEEARRKAEEEARRKIAAQQRAERIKCAEEEYIKREKEESTFITYTEEGKDEFMANCIKLVKEKLKGSWVAIGSVRGNDAEVIGLDKIEYSGEDGKDRVYLTGGEDGKCFLCINRYSGYFSQTMGEIAFSEDNNYFTLMCAGGGNYIFKREQ